MTEHKRGKSDMENELDDTRAKLEAMEESLRIQHQVSYVAGLFQGDITVRTLTESFAEGLIVVDSNGVIVLINQRVGEMFGYNREEVVGRKLDIFLPIRFLEQHHYQVAGYLKNPYVRPMGYGYELYGRRKDGAEFPIEISLSHLKTENGLLGMAFVTDTTLRKETEDELKRRNVALDSFAHTVAHDLSASLATITGYGELLVENHTRLSSEELGTHLESIVRNGRKMQNIINELLLFASVRKDEVNLSPLNMLDIVNEVLQRLSYMISEHQADIVIPDSFPEAMGYGPWIEEIWLNYVSNAIKYGGHSPRVILGSTVLGDGNIKFWVEDNGKGLTDEQKAKLFVVLQRLEETTIKGHGLGLSIVKRIADKLGAEVGVESEVGRGSKFSFVLSPSK